MAVDECQVSLMWMNKHMSSLFRYMGGIPRSFNFPGRRGDNKKATGPIVDSGGARIKPDASKGTPMSDYPEGVSHPENRYTTDYGTRVDGIGCTTLVINTCL